jgi:RNA polymerase sigma-32 factor
MNMLPSVPGGSLSQYLKHIETIPRLTQQQEQDLLIKIADNCAQSAQKLIVHNLRLVAFIAKRMHNTHISFEDLIQEGNTALMLAVKNFNLTIGKGVRFASFAAMHIKGSILQFIQRNMQIVAIATTKPHKKIFNNKSLFTGNTLDSDEAAYIAEHLNVEIHDVIEMHKRLHTSFHATFINDEGEMDDVVIEDPRYNPEALLIDYEDYAETQRKITAINDVLQTLSERDRSVLQERWCADKKVILKDLGIRYGLSTERIRQIESKVLQHIKNTLVTG